MITILPEPIKGPYPLADDIGVGDFCPPPDCLRPHSMAPWSSSMNAIGKHPANLNQSCSHMQARPDELRIEIPLLPREILAMTRILGEAPVDLTQLGSLAKSCSQLTERTLRLCQSSLFRIPQTISGLEQAVIIAGAETIRILMLTGALLDYARLHHRQDDVQFFWRHSMIVAQFSKRIAEWLGESQPEHAYLAGILHDVGMLPLLAGVKARAQQDAPSLQAIGDAPGPQRFRYGIDHTEIGRRLGTMWNFPDLLIETFSSHHMPSEYFPAFPLVRIVAVAEQIARLHGACWEANNIEPETVVRNRAERYLLDYIPSLTSKAAIQLNHALEDDLQATQKKLDISLGPMPSSVPS